MNYIGIDYGWKVMGLSWGSDQLQMAVPLHAIHGGRFLSQALDNLQRVLQTHRCDAFVVGLPLHLDGAAGKRVQDVNHFVEQLKNRFSLPVFLQDERFSTQVACALLGIDGLPLAQAKKKKSAGTIDSQAATVILTEFLQQRRSMA